MRLTIIRVLDVETTGLTDEDRVIEIGWTDVILPAREITAPQSYLCGTTREITPENRAIHHINPTTLIGKPEFDWVIFNAQAKADGVTCFAAHNAAYDSIYVKPKLPIICTYRCALRAWPEFSGHGNSVVRYSLEALGRQHGFNYSHAATHRAGPDSYVTAWTLRALLEDGHTGKTLLQWSKEPPLFPRIPLGKFKGQPWSAADTGWLQWAAFKSELSDDVKYNARLELDRRS